MRDAEPTGDRAGRSDHDDSRLSQQQFAALFEQSWRTLWTIGVAVLGRRDEVDDVLQESALIALGKLEDFDPATSFTAWMGQIVRYTALNSGRRRQRRNERISSGDAMLEHSTAVESSGRRAFDGSDQQSVDADRFGFDDQLLEGLSRLSEAQRICLLLRVVNGSSYREIALAMDMPEGTAMSHVHRAQKSLRSAMGPTQDAPGRSGAHQ